MAGGDRVEPIDGLLLEYEIHGGELSKRLELHDRVLAIIHGLAVVLGGLVVAFISSDGVDAAPQWTAGPGAMLVAVFLVVALAVALQLGTSLTSSSYVFMVLRRRMAEIEDELNHRYGTENLFGSVGNFVCGA